MAKIHFLILGLFTTVLAGCFHPPFNNFKKDHATTRTVVGGTIAGATVGAIASSTVTGAVVGGGAGAAIGGLIGLQKESKANIIKELKKQNIQYIAYGDTMTLIVPTDKYFMFNSPRLNEVCYPGLNNIIKLLKFYPKSPIYVAGFTDNVGSSHHKKLLSQSQAETMMTFLWGHNIASSRLKAEGYGDKNDIADNALIHGSAMNRRIEIQWFSSPVSNISAAIASRAKD